MNIDLISTHLFLVVHFLFSRHIVFYLYAFICFFFVCIPFYNFPILFVLYPTLLTGFQHSVMKLKINQGFTIFSFASSDLSCWNHDSCQSTLCNSASRSEQFLNWDCGITELIYIFLYSFTDFLYWLTTRFMFFVCYYLPEVLNIFVACL